MRTSTLRPETLQNSSAEVSGTVTILIGKYEFEGPFENPNTIKNREGISIVLCQKGEDYELMDVSEARDLHTYLQTHDLKDFWKDNCQGHLGFAVLYTDGIIALERHNIKQSILAEFETEGATA